MPFLLIEPGLVGHSIEYKEMLVKKTCLLFMQFSHRFGLAAVTVKKMCGKQKS